MTAPPAGRYFAWGLRIRSQVALPGAVLLAPDTSAVDIDIALGSRSLTGPVRSDGPYRVGANGFDVSIPGVARYAYDGERRLLIDPAADADAEDVSAMLIATALPAVLWARGEFVLHAAAAILPGTQRAVAVLGRSGSGKSRLLARVIALGAQAVADDSICVRIEAGRVEISGLPGGYYDPLGSSGTRAFHRIEPSRQCPHAELGALIVLDDQSEASGRLTGAAAVAALLANRHRPRITHLLGNERNTFEVVTQVGRYVPLYKAATLEMNRVAILGKSP